MLYRHQFKGSEYTTSVVGLPNPRWGLESFSLESDLRDLWWDVKPNEVVLDVGAGFGSYTLTALARGATVYACEPDKELLFALAANVMINRFGPRCVLLPCMVADISGVVVGFDMASHSGRPALHPMEHRIAATVDSLVAGYGLTRLDWLKIDVEGTEVEVFRGAEQTFKNLRPKVIVENHVEFREKVVEMLTAVIVPYGYVPEHRLGQGINDNWTLWRPV